jgi:hypothetical protein
VNDILMFLGNLSLLQWILFSLLPVGIIVITTFQRYIRSQFKFAQNLRRRIYFFSTPGKNMQKQKDNLKYLSYLKVDSEIREYENNTSQFQRLDKNSVFIIGYSEDLNLEAILQYSSDNNIPVLLFAEPGEVKRDWQKIGGHMLCDVVNSTSRLSIILLDFLRIS